MRHVMLVGFSAIVLLAFATGSTLAKPAKDTGLAQNEEVAVIIVSDWLLDLIFDLFGITAADLLNNIYSVLRDMDLIVEGAVKELERILILLNPKAKEEIERIISVSMKQVNDFMAPIIEQLEEVLPVISSLQQTKVMSVSDWIMALLGITLEEFLTSITTALTGVNKLIGEAIADLDALAEELDGEAEETVENVVENMFVEGLKVILG